jgi:hypothetical protein
VIRRGIAIVCLTAFVALLLPLAACVIQVALEGDYVAPDRLRMTVNLGLGGEEFLAIEVVSIGDTSYVLDPDTGRWVTSDEFEDNNPNLSILDLDFADSVLQMIRAFRFTSLLDTQIVDGAPCYHFAGILDSAALETLDLEAPAGGGEPLHAEIWIGKDDLLIRRFTASGAGDSETSSDDGPASDAGITITYEFSQFNEPVSIEAPDLTGA